ncbi:hypothetical protein [Escherichia coli]|uniref:hypothetical protein n=3 Tax=Gammaproteobacteria TaxID=1236 RepID=UPI0039E10CAB
MSTFIQITEVGPRDGFQNIKAFIPTDLKIKIIDRLVESGIGAMEITSMVSPKAIPQMRDAREVIQHVLNTHPHIIPSVLVPNVKGASLASEAGIQNINYVVSVSPAHNKANINRTHAESLEDLYKIRHTFPEMTITLSLATVFGCPFIGETSRETLMDMIKFADDLGISAVTLCDTIGVANPQGDPLILFLGVVCVVIAIIFTAIAYGRVTQEADKSRRNKGLITAILAGIIMGWFFRFLADSMSDNFSQPASGLMTPYSALVLFAMGLFLSNFVLNRLVMKKPISGEPVNGKMYFSGSLRDHVCGWLGGMIWCVGLAFSLIASGQAGYAISYGLGQGATMIAVIWGVFIWREFASAPAGTNKLLLTMFISYIVGIVLIIAANQ